MGNRVIVGTASNLVLGRMYEDSLRQVGVPITAMPMEAGSEAFPSGPVNLWLEDADLLRDPDVAGIIEDFLRNPKPLPEDFSGDAPVAETEKPPSAAWPVAGVFASWLGLVLFVPIAIGGGWLMYMLLSPEHWAPYFFILLGAMIVMLLSLRIRVNALEANVQAPDRTSLSTPASPPVEDTEAKPESD